MEALHKKLERLHRDKEKIEREIAAIHAQQQQALYDSIKTFMPIDMDPAVIIGGLLSIFEHARTQPATAEVWRQAGQKFQRQRHTARPSSNIKTVSPDSAAPQPRSETIPALAATDQTSHHGI